ncbi:hypothetical protein N601_08115 [Rhodococcus erythropolis DN1]|nr:hypothetical protein N601_08115 [Rhodococcus erythropolis DN1]
MTAASGTATVVGGLGAVGSMFVELLRAGVDGHRRRPSRQRS